VGKHLTLGNTYHCWQCANYASDICSRGTDITSEMCSGAHISRGNIYHCNSGMPIFTVNSYRHLDAHIRINIGIDRGPKFA